MSRKLIVAFIVAAILMVMVGAMVYEAFDIHDPKPFPIDPEFLVCVVSTFLVLCLSTVVLSAGLLQLYIFLVGLISFRLLGFTPTLVHQYEAFEIEHILFSPPLSPVSLRI